jgi:broad specificity phosphatase PhoE
MKIILTRHGETEGNVAQVLIGQIDSPLTAQGISQAEKLGQYLAKKGFTFNAIYCSPLGRTKKTFELLSKHFQTTEPIFEPLIMESNMGEAEGKPRKSVDWAHPPKGSETMTDLIRRGKEFLSQLNPEANETILVIAHGGINKGIIAAAVDIDKFVGFTQDNCNITILEYINTKWWITLLNYTEHLG